MPFRAVLQGPKDGNGQVSRIDALSHGGDKAAIAARWPCPLDLRTVAIRNDLGELLIMSSWTGLPNSTCLESWLGGSCIGTTFLPLDCRHASN